MGSKLERWGGSMARVIACACTLPLSGCGSGPSPVDAGRSDGGASMDAAVAADAGSLDAGSVDGRVPSPDASAGDAGTQADAAPLVYRVTPGATRVTLIGSVRDADTHAPIAGAVVAGPGAETAATGEDGAFAISLPAGRALVSISAPGFLTWRAQVALSGRAVPLTVELASAAAPVTITTAGGAVAMGDATLQFPAGAYAADTEVRATWLPGGEARAISREAFYPDPDGRGRHVLGVLQVDAATEPSMPVELTVPAPAGVAASDLRVEVGRVPGMRGERIAPIRTAGNLATFALPHFSEHTLDGPAGGAPLIDITSSSGELEVFPAGGAAVPADPGVAYPAEGTSLLIGPGASVTLQDAAGTEWALLAPDDDSLGVTFYGQDEPAWSAPGAPTGIRMHYQRARTAALELISGFVTVATSVYDGSWGSSLLTEPTMRAIDQIVTDDGTVFSVGTVQCDQELAELPWLVTEVEVSEGRARVDTASGATTVAAGERARACSGCPDPTMEYECCNDTNCPDGCCTSDDRCEPGDVREACGFAGQACALCSRPGGGVWGMRCGATGCADCMLGQPGCG